LIDVNAGNACTTANKALQAIIVAEIEHAVDHEAQCIGITAGAIDTAALKPSAGAARNCRERAGEALEIGFAIANFSFKAETAKVIADNATKIITGIGVSGCIDRRSADVIIEVFNKHRTAVDSDIPLAIAGH
jgi:hypothetical protein